MDNDSVYTIYGLKDPRTDLVRYIGITVNHPTVRLKEHLKKAHQLNTPKDHWLCQLQHLGLKPSVVILAFAADAVEAKAIEKLWIQSEFASGWELTNSDHLTSSYDRRISQTGFFGDDRRSTPHWADWLHGLLSQLLFAFSPLKHKAMCEAGNSGLYPGCRCCPTVTSQPVNALNTQRTVVGADGWTTAPRRSQAVGEAREHLAGVQGRTDVRDVSGFRTHSQRPQAAPAPTLTEKQERVFAYFEANARYDKVKQAWVFPTVKVMAEETGCAGSYVQGLKVEWIENKVIEGEDIERLDPRDFRENVLRTRLEAPSPEPTLTEKQERIFAYFNEHAVYDKLKMTWVYPSVRVIAKDLDTVPSYVHELKLKWEWRNLV